jgi:ATP-dependent exoDNAse (exonuclease V) beta subunit
MTFTRKAAGEIRERILRALLDPEPAPDADPSRRETCRLARCALERDADARWALVEHPARLQIHTIDALCMALVRQAPLAARVGTLPRPVERAEGLYAEAAREELLAAGPDDEAWRRLLDYLDNDSERAVTLLAGLLSKREQWLPRLVGRDAIPLRAALERVLDEELCAVLAAFVRALPRPMRASLEELTCYAACNVDPSHALAPYAGGTGLPPATAAGLAHWQAIARWLLTGNRLRKSVTVRDGFPPQRPVPKRAMEELLSELASIPDMARSLANVRALPPARYDDGSWAFIEALLIVLPRAAARLRLIFARRGVMDFNEATIVALQALETEGEVSDLLLALDTRIEHLLVDEFQDTSFAQCALLAHLTAGWTSGDGRTLFLVGDPMQSIYRFRDANVRLFLDARSQRAQGSVTLEPLTLTSNFRSQRRLVEWINGVFPAVLAPRDDAVRGAIAFTEAHAARSEARDPAVTLDLATDDRREAEAAVARIRAALATPAQTIAVLVRKRADLEELLPALRSAAIAYTAVELDRLADRQAMLDLAALTHALVQPDDRAAWLAVLRAPWCGLTLPDLFALNEACGGRTLAEAIFAGDTSCIGLSENGLRRLKRFAQAHGAVGVRSRGVARARWSGLRGRRRARPRRSRTAVLAD